LFSANGPTRTFARTGVGLRTLPTYWQPSSVTYTTIHAQVHQPFDIHGDLASQVALEHVFANLAANALDFGFCQVFDLG
jgi:hypothetical protein